MHHYLALRPNSPGPLMDDWKWKVMDDSSVNFHDVFFFIFCQIIAKNDLYQGEKSDIVYYLVDGPTTTYSRVPI